MIWTSRFIRLWELKVVVCNSGDLNTAELPRVYCGIDKLPVTTYCI